MEKYKKMESDGQFNLALKVEKEDSFEDIIPEKKESVLTPEDIESVYKGSNDNRELFDYNNVIKKTKDKDPEEKPIPKRGGLSTMISFDHNK